MKKSIPFSDFQNTLNYSGIVRKFISDIPNSTPADKRVDFAAMLCVINASIESTKHSLGASPVIVVTDITNPSLSTVLANEVMDEYRLLPPVKYIPGWRHAPVSIKLACMHALLSVQPRGVFKPFTLNFRSDIVARAFHFDKGPREYFRNRVRHHLNCLAPALFWQTYEKGEGGVIHVHGSLHLADDVPEHVIRGSLQAAGGPLEGKARGTQAVFSRPIRDCEVGWATYGRKASLQFRQLFGGDAYSASDKLRRGGRVFYESVSKFLNDQRRIL